MIVVKAVLRERVPPAVSLFFLNEPVNGIIPGNADRPVSDDRPSGFVPSNKHRDNICNAMPEFADHGFVVGSGHLLDRQAAVRFQPDTVLGRFEWDPGFFESVPVCEAFFS